MDNCSYKGHFKGKGIVNNDILALSFFKKENNKNKTLQ